MSKINTDEIRQTMKNLTVNEDVITYRNYCDTQLHQALDEIDELHGLEKLFEMQHRRSQEADKRWQKATGKHDTIPDLGNLLQWLMNEIDRLAEKSTIEKHVELLDVATRLTEQRTKDACFEAGWKWYVKFDTRRSTFGEAKKAFKQAIDSAGVK